MADPKTKKVEIENLDKKPTSVPFTSLYKSTKDGVRYFEQNNSIELTDAYLFKLNLGETSYLTGKKEADKEGNAANYVYLDASVLDEKTAPIFENSQAAEKVELDGNISYRLKADNITMMDVGQKERGFQISVIEGSEKITINAGARGFVVSQDGARLMSKAPEDESCFSFHLSENFIANLFDERELHSSIQTTTGTAFKDYSPEFMLAIARIPELRKSGLAQPYTTRAFGNFEFFSAENVKGKNLDGGEAINNLVFVRDKENNQLFVLNDNKFQAVQATNFTYLNSVNGESNVAISLKVGSGSKTTAVRVPISLPTKEVEGKKSYTEGSNFQVLSGIAKFVNGDETEVNNNFTVVSDGAMDKINLNGIVLNPHEYSAHSDIKTNAIRENIVNLDEIDEINANVENPEPEAQFAQPDAEQPQQTQQTAERTETTQQTSQPQQTQQPQTQQQLDAPEQTEQQEQAQNSPSNGNASTDNASSNNNSSNDAGVITRKVDFGPFSDFCKAAGPLLVIVGVALAVASLFVPGLAILLDVGTGLCVAGAITYFTGKSSEKFEKTIEYPMQKQKKAKKERQKATEKYRERANEIEKLREEAREATGKTKAKLEKKISNLEKTNFELLSKGDIRQVRAIMKDIQENSSNYPENYRANFFENNVSAITLTVMDSTSKKVTKDFLSTLTKQQRERINETAKEIGQLAPEQYSEARTKELIGESGANYLENRYKRNLETQIKQKQERLTDVETKNLRVLDKDSDLYQTFVTEAEELANEISELKREESGLELHIIAPEKAIALRNKEKHAAATVALIDEANAAPVAETTTLNQPVQEETAEATTVNQSAQEESAQVDEETAATQAEETKSENGYTVEDYAPIIVPEAVFDDANLQQDAQEETSSHTQENNQRQDSGASNPNSSNSEEEEDENERSR